MRLLNINLNWNEVFFGGGEGGKLCLPRVCSKSKSNFIVIRDGGNPMG